MTPTHFKLFTLLLLLTGIAGCKTGQDAEQTEDVVTDIDGNEYHTITIGTQVWMSEDLKTTRYNDGTAIPLVTSYDEWSSLATPAYSWYNNDSTNKRTYGALYNWFAVNTNKLCPEGWHVPSDEEWNELEKSFGELGIAGGALKETGTEHWRSPNAGATNESGFSALPGGYRSYNGTFNLLRAYGYWWSSTESNWWSSIQDRKDIIFYRDMRYDDSNLNRYVAIKTNGFCVRCLKDQ